METLSTCVVTIWEICPAIFFCTSIIKGLAINSILTLYIWPAKVQDFTLVWIKPHKMLLSKLYWKFDPTSHQLQPIETWADTFLIENACVFDTEPQFTPRATIHTRCLHDEEIFLTIHLTWGPRSFECLSQILPGLRPLHGKQTQPVQSLLITETFLPRQHPGESPLHSLGNILCLTYWVTSAICVYHWYKTASAVSFYYDFSDVVRQCFIKLYQNQYCWSTRPRRLLRFIDQAGPGNSGSRNPCLTITIHGVYISSE